MMSMIDESEAYLWWQKGSFASKHDAGVLGHCCSSIMSHDILEL